MSEKTKRASIVEVAKAVIAIRRAERTQIGATYLGVQIRDIVDCLIEQNPDLTRLLDALEWCDGVVAGRYLRKELAVDAILWTGENLLQLDRFLGVVREKTPDGNDWPRPDAITIESARGNKTPRIGDFIARDVVGDIFIYPNDIFKMLHDPMED